MLNRVDQLRDLVEDYDVLLCDVWGVLHNGVVGNPSAVTALELAKAAGKTIILITNSSRISPEVVAQLRYFGVKGNAYDRVVTSGDVTRILIANGPKKIFLIGPNRPTPLLDGLGVERVAAEAADVIVCTGFFDDETETPEDYTAMLEDFSARKVPMICANPDLVVERGNQMIPCAGALAAHYQRLGGETLVAGKPHAPIYEASLSQAHTIRGSIKKPRVLAIGDGVPTDMRGGQNCGFDLLFIGSGIHHNEYMIGDQTDEARLSAFLTREAISATWWMPKLA